jgi:ABC-2 type transport system permease protein
LRFVLKELLETLRTWRLPVVGGVLLFLAVMSPLAALAAPALVKSLTSSQPGVVIELPPATYLDSYAQWVKNLSQIGMMLVIFSSAGLISTETASGTAAMVLSKPVSRSSFVVAKFVVQAVLVKVSLLVGTAVVLLGTRLAFGEAPAVRLLAAVCAWLVLAVVLMALAECFSAVMSTVAAAVMTLVVWGVAGVVALWRPLVEWTPVGLLGAPSALLAGKSADVAVPALTGVFTAFALVALAAALYSRREL